MLFEFVLIVYPIFVYGYQSTNLASFLVDWYETYYPATLVLLQGGNPYQVPTLYNPVWSLYPLIPFALLGEVAGGVAMFFTAFSVYVWAAFKLGGTRNSVLFFILSPLVFYNLMLGNIDWLVVLGYFIPPPFGLFFLSLKPQIGLLPALYWAWAIYKRGGLADVVKSYAPVIICLLLSFVIYGNWISGRDARLIGVDWNLSVFPYGIPAGLYLVYLAIRGKINRAVSASPFFSPYLSAGSWSIAQLGAVDNPRVSFFITATLWLLFVVGRWLGF